MSNKTINRIKRILDINEEHGYAEAELVEKENQHKIKIPPILREFYLTVGKHEKLNNEKIRVNFVELFPSYENDHGKLFEDYLIIYREEQALYYWAIRKDEINNQDCQVYRTEGYPDGWVIEDQNLEKFLIKMAIHQAVFTAPFVFNKKVLMIEEEKRLRKIASSPFGLFVHRTYQHVFFEFENVYILLETSFHLPSKRITIASHDQKSLNNFKQHIGFDE